MLCRSSVEYKGKNQSNFLVPKTCSKFLLHPTSYFQATDFLRSWTSIEVVLLVTRDVCMPMKQRRLSANTKLRTKARNRIAISPGELERLLSSRKNPIKSGSSTRVSRTVSRKVYTYNSKKMQL
uniref:Uncharacterized protein n=1 Tax=Arundo donax TaxID=35708 RepID=A0A0A9CM87_ARUDO